jgi:hypothetical protein
MTEIDIDLNVRVVLRREGSRRRQCEHVFHLLRSAVVEGLTTGFLSMILEHLLSLIISDDDDEDDDISVD